MDLGAQLELNNALPDADNYIRAIDLIVQYCFKDRWAAIAQKFSFHEIDVNGDGSICRTELRDAIKWVLGEEPSDALMDGMVGAIDEDANGIIDEEEFNRMLSKMRNPS